MARSTNFVSMCRVKADFHAVIVPVEGDPGAYERTLSSLAALAADQSSGSKSRETELMQ